MRPCLAELLSRQAELRPERAACIFLDDSGEVECAWSFRELHAMAGRVAAQVRERIGARDGRPAPIPLVFSHSREFIPAFWGVVYSGNVPVPLAAPGISRHHLGFIQAVLSDLDAPFLLVGERQRAVLQVLVRDAAGFLVVDPSRKGAELHSPAGGAGETALIQFSSGSVGDPKGIVITHGNLLENQALIAKVFRTGPEDVVGTWLPHYHDMGLVGTLMHPLYAGIPAVILQPVAFVQKPLLWLRMIDRHGVTMSGAPNFGYEHCLKRGQAAQGLGLDLSRWRLAFNGAEPVNFETMRRFAEVFAGSGFSLASFLPCYGLAESTLMVCGSAGPKATVHSCINAGKPMVSCGKPEAEVRVRIVDPVSRRERPAGEEGEIWVRSPSVGAGYFGKPLESRETFGAVIPGEEESHLRTGDLGFLDAAGELHVTGRLKDLIIVRGRNIYPQDLERLSGELAGSSSLAGAAALQVDWDGRQAVVVIQEAKARGREAKSALAMELRSALAAEFGVVIDFVLVVPPGTLPKTTSGKIKRQRAREIFLHFKAAEREEAFAVVPAQ